MAINHAVGVVLAFLLALVLFKYSPGRKLKSLPLPPGPKGLPFVGNISDLPPPGVPEFQHWLQHKENYGLLSSITVLGQTMIIIHDKEAAFELMEKRAHKHSGRPSMKFGMEMCGGSELLAMRPYGHTHRLYRKYVYQQLGSKAAMSKYDKLREVAVGRFMWRLIHDEGKNLVKHLNTEAADVMLSIVYGYNIEPHKSDPLVEDVGKAIQQFSDACVPGKWAVDVIPILEYLPEWLPGTGFKRTARLWKKTMTDVADIPFDFAKDNMSRSQHRGSFVSKSIEQARQEQTCSPENEYAIKWSAASMYTGGADTSVSTMVAFFLAMSMFPEVQRKAQEEIDRVVGDSRLPNASDRERLPYVTAVVEEAQRWHPIAPMSLPHAVDEEDTIRGFRIPKGAVLIPAVWWFTRDPAVYHEPEAFKPERFLAPYNEPSATNVIFGFGRRICPGKLLADTSLYLIFAQSLAALSVRKASKNGCPIEPEHTFESGIIAHPGQFGVKVEARNKQWGELVEAVVADNPWQEGDAKYIKRV